MEVNYRQSFLKDLKNLKGSSVYQRIYEIAFTTLPELRTYRNSRTLKPCKDIQPVIVFE